MPYILLGGPLAGILTALVSVVAEQFLAAAINIFSGREVVLDVYTHLGFFLVAAAIIEESFKYFSAVFVLRRYLGLNRFKFVSASLIAGIFFGGAETYLVLLTNGKRIWEIGSLDGNTFFSLSALLCLEAAIESRFAELEKQSEPFYNNWPSAFQFLQYGLHDHP